MPLQQEFGKDIPYIGCEFHWKQAIRRKLISYRLPIDHVTKIIGDKGYMEILCYIPIEEIIPEGIPYMRSLMHELEIQHPGPYDSFWKYFMKTWTSTYNQNTWNIYNTSRDPCVTIPHASMILLAGGLRPRTLEMKLL